MKKIISLVVISLIIMTGVISFADDNIYPMPVLISEKAVPMLYDLNDNPIPELYDENSLELNIKNNITMIPLRSTLEDMGYTVKWNDENRTVEINKGAQYTMISIDKNSYFKNKMAPISLSCAPIIVNDKTLLPIEFFTEILNKGINIENGEISVTDEEMAIHSGYVKEITINEKGNKTITISSKIDTNELMDQIIIHTDENTIFNKNVIKGGFINVISPPIMTMSFPAQTYGTVIY